MRFNQESPVAHSGRSVPEFHRSSLFIRSIDTPQITFNTFHPTSRSDLVKSRWVLSGSRLFKWVTLAERDLVSE